MDHEMPIHPLPLTGFRVISHWRDTTPVCCMVQKRDRRPSLDTGQSDMCFFGLWEEVSESAHSKNVQTVLGNQHGSGKNKGVKNEPQHTPSSEL